MDYYTKGLEIIKRIKPERNVYHVQALSGIHQYYVGISDMDRSDSILREILKIDPDRENYYAICHRYMEEARLRSAAGRNIEALAYLGEAENLVPKENEELSGVFYRYKAETLLNMKSYSKAKRFALEALRINKKTDTKESIRDVYSIISEIEYKLGNHELSREYIQKHIVTKDSLLNEKSMLNQDVLSAKYASAEKESKINLLKAQEAKNNMKIQKQRFFLLSFMGGLGLLGLFLLSLLKSNKEKKLSNQLLKEKNQIIQTKSDQNETLLKEIHHRVKNNLQTISSLLYLQSANISDDDAKEAIAQGQHRVESMALIHKNLYQGDNLAGIEIKDYISRLVSNLKDAYIKSD